MSKKLGRFRLEEKLHSRRGSKKWYENYDKAFGKDIREDDKPEKTK